MKKRKGNIINLVWPDLDFINEIAQDRTALEQIFNPNGNGTIIESGRSLLLKNLNTILTQEETEALNIFVPYIHNFEQDEIKDTLESIYSAHTKITISWFLREGLSNIDGIDIDSRIKIPTIKKSETKKNITSQYCLTKAFLGDEKTAVFDTKGLEKAIRVCISDKLVAELKIKKPGVDAPTFFENNTPAIEGVSDPIKKMKKRIHRVAKTNLNVLLIGETGSGKEAAAFFIHDLNKDNRGNPFEVRNCAFFDKEFMISELFGHIDGAYTGTKGDRKGLLEELGEGTLFLDELPEMPLRCQAMLLRFLEDGIVRPLGSNKEKGPYKNIRIIGAGQPDLIKRNLRSDLVFRIGEKKISIPPLRDIVNEDLSGLIDHLLYKNSEDPKKRYDAKTFFDDNQSLLKKYPWPGNVRELASFVKRRLQMEKEEEQDIIEEIKSSWEEEKEEEIIKNLTQNNQTFDDEFKSLIHKFRDNLKSSKHVNYGYTVYVSEELEGDKTQKGIADTLHISEGTRKNHLSQFLKVLKLEE